MIQLYFLRHSIAVPRGTPGYPDDDRPLTQQGIDKMTRAARGMKASIGPLDVLLTSPLKRAHDTAVIVAKALGVENRLEDAKALMPGCTLKTLLPLLAKYKNKGEVMIVGHEPDFSAMIADLLGARQGSVVLKKGALCHIELDAVPPKEPKLVKLLQPKQLRGIAKKK